MTPACPSSPVQTWCAPAFRTHMQQPQYPRCRHVWDVNCAAQTCVVANSPVFRLNIVLANFLCYFAITLCEERLAVDVVGTHVLHAVGVTRMFRFALARPSLACAKGVTPASNNRASSTDRLRQHTSPNHPLYTHFERKAYYKQQRQHPAVAAVTASTRSASTGNNHGRSSDDLHCRILSPRNRPPNTNTELAPGQHCVSVPSVHDTHVCVASAADQSDYAAAGAKERPRH